MKVEPKVMLVVLGVIFVALGIMLFLAVQKPDRTQNDENNYDGDTNSARVFALVLDR
jgi:hypothetical protein